MSEAKLPAHIDPLTLCKNQQELVGKIPLARFKRVKELVLADDGEVEVCLKFDQDRYGNPWIHGRIAAVLRLECQRCGQPFDLKVEPGINLHPVAYEAELAGLNKECEPLVTEGKPISLQQLIEDELLLSIPMVPKHEEAECSVNLAELNQR